MRSILILSVILLSITMVASQTIPLTQPQGNYLPGGGTDQDYNGMCTLDDWPYPGLKLTDGLELTETFKRNKYIYFCKCTLPNWNNIPFYGDGSPRVKTITDDPMSNAQVWFNGHPVNTKDHNGALQNTNLDPPYATSQPLGSFEHQWIDDFTNEIDIIVSCSPPEGEYPDGENPHCAYHYKVYCFRPKRPPGGSTQGDPQFVGLRGQNYQVHGVAGEIYNIVSDRELQFNSRFVFLDQGDCPVVNGRKQKNCWSHPGSYLGELGIKTKSGDKVHVLTGDAKSGFALIELNGKPMEVGDSMLLADNMGSISRNSTHLMELKIGNWEFSFENSDMFVNQKVRVLDARSLRSHGLLGQTWRETTYPNPIKYIQGQVDDYVIRDNDIFGDNFVYNTFN